MRNENCAEFKVVGSLGDSIELVASPNGIIVI